MVYLYSVENVISLGKLIGLLFCLPSSLFFFVKNSKNTRSSPCNGNHFSSICVRPDDHTVSALYVACATRAINKYHPSVAF